MVRGLLIAVAYLVVQAGIQASGGATAGASVDVVYGLSRSVACKIFPDQELNVCPLHWQADS